MSLLFSSLVFNDGESQHRAQVQMLAVLPRELRMGRPLFPRDGLWQKVGERGRNRTFNLLIKSQLLCQLSYAPTL